jgi:hypothetical protein
MLTSMLLLVIAALSLLTAAEAGCYRGRPRPVIPPEDFHWNDEAAPLLESKHLPRHFDWSDMDGENMLVASWGQHQPIYCGSCWVHGTLSMVGLHVTAMAPHMFTSAWSQAVPMLHKGHLSAHAALLRCKTG